MTGAPIQDERVNTVTYDPRGMGSVDLAATLSSAARILEEAPPAPGVHDDGIPEGMTVDPNTGELVDSGPSVPDHVLEEVALALADAQDKAAMLKTWLDEVEAEVRSLDGSFQKLAGDHVLVTDRVEASVAVVQSGGRSVRKDGIARYLAELGKRGILEVEEVHELRPVGPVGVKLFDDPKVVHALAVAKIPLSDLVAEAGKKRVVHVVRLAA